MVKILFVCTGNMLRSASAEHALKKFLYENKEKVYKMCGFSYSEIKVSSCGTNVSPQPMHKSIIDEFQKKGINIFNHMYMQIDKTLVDESDLIVCMGNDHKQYLKKHFKTNPHLFNEICDKKQKGTLDDWEALGEHKDKKKEDQYLRRVVNHICESMPYFVINFPKYLR